MDEWILLVEEGNKYRKENGLWLHHPTDYAIQGLKEAYDFGYLSREFLVAELVLYQTTLWVYGVPPGNRRYA